MDGRYSMRTVLLLGSIFLVPVTAVASVLNGDFETGDLSEWSRYTDGSIGSVSDFSVPGALGSYRARIEADYWVTPGDVSSTSLNAVIFGNILSQNLNTTVIPGKKLTLSFDWSFGGQDGNGTSGEIFSVGLFNATDYFKADGTLGFLIDPTTSYGSGTFTTNLDTATFANMVGWSLDFQLEVGANVLGMVNGFGSYVEIDNVSLTRVQQVPEPSSPVLVLIGLLGVFKVRQSKLTR